MKHSARYSIRALILTGLLVIVFALGACADTAGPADMDGTVVEEPAADDAVATEVMEEADVDETDSTETETTTETDTDVETEVMTETDTIDVVTTTEVTTETDVITETDVMTETEVMVEGEEPEATEEPMEEPEATEEPMEEPEAMEGEAPADAIAGVSGAEGALMRGFTLLDYDFDNRDNEVSGDLEDLLVDLSTGDILFTSIEYGGFLDLGDKDIIVPLSAFTWGPEGRLVLNFDEQALDAFPDVGNDWPDITNAGWDDDVNTFWRDIDIDPGFDFDETNASGVMWLSDMTGFTLTDLGEGLGSVHDVLVDVGESRIKYLLVGYGATTAGADSFIVPYSAFDTQNFADGELAFDENVDLTSLQAAPRFGGARFVEDSDLFAEDFEEEVRQFWQDEGFEVD